MRLPGRGAANLFTGGPSITIPELPPIPTRASAPVRDAGEAEKALRRRRGRRQTQLTGGAGVTDEATIKRPTLGAA